MRLGGFSLRKCILKGISPILIKISFSYSFQYSFLDMHICFCQNLCKFMIKNLSYEVTCKYAIYKNPLRTNQANFHAKIYKPCSFSTHRAVSLEFSAPNFEEIVAKNIFSVHTENFGNELVTFSCCKQL